MASYQESPLDLLWKEYGSFFRDFDDTSLGRWMAQTLGQLNGRAWRSSHPLVGAYRLAAQIAEERQVWLKRLVTPPSVYSEATCCRAPLLPLITRDILESGLLCQHCGDTTVAWEDLPSELQAELRPWAEEYSPAHQVAHWDDDERRRTHRYDDRFESAAHEVERMLGALGTRIAPKFLEHYPAVVWEDQDECLEVRPEDIKL